MRIRYFTLNFYFIDVNVGIDGFIILGTSSSPAVNPSINKFDTPVHTPRLSVSPKRTSMFGLASDSSALCQEPTDYYCRLKKTTIDKSAQHNDQKVFLIIILIFIPVIHVNISLISFEAKLYFTGVMKKGK